MTYNYYPGCSLHHMSVEYHLSTRAVFRHLGIRLQEIDDWNCCGASAAHATDEYLALALPLRNLILAEKTGYDVLVPCAACYNVFRLADHEVRKGDARAKRVNHELEGLLGFPYRASLKIKHALEPFGEKEVLDNLAEHVTVPLEGLRVAPYYGCLLSRPPAVVAFDNPEQPCLMDRLMERLGARVVRWSYKTDCCGASLTVAQPEHVNRLVGMLVREARRAGAEAIVTACPLCQSNLESRQGEAEDKMPVFFFTELVGVALGIRESKQWFSKHLHDPQPLLQSLRLIG